MACGYASKENPFPSGGHSFYDAHVLLRNAELVGQKAGEFSVGCAINGCSGNSDFQCLPKFSGICRGRRIRLNVNLYDRAFIGVAHEPMLPRHRSSFEGTEAFAKVL